MAVIGFELSTGYWGYRYATELAQMLLRFGFERLGLDQVTAHCVVENTASAHVLEKIGVVQLQRLPESERMGVYTWTRSSTASRSRRGAPRNPLAPNHALHGDPLPAVFSGF